MRALLNWFAAAASPIGLFVTLWPVSGALTPWQAFFLLLFILGFGTAAFFDIREERRRVAKTYRNPAAINNYMHAMLLHSGRCEICSRDASWIKEERLHALLIKKARDGELFFLVHKITPELRVLEQAGAQIIEYAHLGFEPLARFTIVNSGNLAKSYVAIGRQKPGEPHIIEELDSSHPAYSMALDLIRAVKTAHDNFEKN